MPRKRKQVEEQEAPPPQRELLADGPPDVARLEYVDVDLIQPDSELAGGKPDPRLVASVRAMGVLEPVLLRRRTATGRYDVLAGRRRVKAARLAERTLIPAAVYDESDTHVTDMALTTLAENAARSDNPAAELEALALLEPYLDAGELVQRPAGMTAATMRRALKLRGLVPELREALAAGDLSPHLARIAAVLPKGLQAEVVDAYDENGRITQEDVAAVKRVRSGGAIAQLEDDLFGEVPRVDCAHCCPTHCGGAAAESPTEDGEGDAE